MFKIVEINSSKANDDALRELYESSFPVGERVPYDIIIKGFDLLDIDYTGYYEDEKLLGLSIIVRLSKYNWGAYFAVKKELRGKGLGQKLLTIILDKYKKEKNPFIIDVESPLQADAPNPEIRKRRHNFPLRNGLRDTGVYFTFNGVSLSVMSNRDEPFSQKDYEEIANAFKPKMDELNKTNKEI